LPILDPFFFAVAVPAILIYGISKGGFGGGVGIMAVPLMALAVPPAQAAAITLPLLIVMDAVGLQHYRKLWDKDAIKAMAPGALVGIGLGTLAFGYFDDDVVRLLLGTIAVLFALNFFRPGAGNLPPREPSIVRGSVWGTVAGFTSTLAHAGGPPANIYLLPLKLDKTLFVGTMVVFFAAINLVKVVPYALLGLFPLDNLLTSLTLVPLAIGGVRLGIRLHSRVDQILFYRLCYIFVLVTGLKLIHDGVT
jgi:uncharacterized protein